MPRQNPALFQNAFGTKDKKKDSDVKGSKMAYSLTKKRVIINFEWIVSSIKHYLN